MEYVCTGAVMKCTMGTSTAKLKATPKNVSLVGKDQANIADFVSMVNVPGFGRCRSLAYPPTAAATAANHGHLTPMPCVPGTCPFWSAVDKNSLVCGQPALLKAATLKCSFGGTISIVSPGQNKEVKAGGSASSVKDAKPKTEKELETAELAELQELDELTVEGLTPESVLDGIQTALDVAGFVPGLGAIPDLLNAGISALRGDWVNAGMCVLAAVPGVGDVAAAGKLAYKGTKLAGATVKTSKTLNKSAKVSASTAKKTTGVSKAISSSMTKSDNVVKMSDTRKTEVYEIHRNRKMEVNGKVVEDVQVTKRTITTNSIEETSASSLSNKGQFVQANNNGVGSSMDGVMSSPKNPAPSISRQNDEVVDINKYRQSKDVDLANDHSGQPFGLNVKPKSYSEDLPELKVDEKAPNIFSKDYMAPKKPEIEANPDTKRSHETVKEGSEGFQDSLKEIFKSKSKQPRVDSCDGPYGPLNIDA